MKTVMELCKEAGLDWQRGFAIDDENNRYENLLALHREQVIKELAGVSLEPVAVVTVTVRGSATKIDLERNDAMHQLPEGEHSLYTSKQLAAMRVQTIEECAQEFDRRAEPETGFYEPEEPAEIIRALKEQKK